MVCLDRCFSSQSSRHEPEAELTHMEAQLVPAAICSPEAFLAQPALVPQGQMQLARLPCCTVCRGCFSAWRESTNAMSGPSSRSARRRLSREVRDSSSSSWPRSSVSRLSVPHGARAEAPAETDRNSCGLFSSSSRSCISAKRNGLSSPGSTPCAGT